MSILCRMFGHTKKSGWYGDGLYGTVNAGPIDGIGRSHFTITNYCDRCKRKYIMARIHGYALLRHLSKHKSSLSREYQGLLK